MDLAIEEHADTVVYIITFKSDENKFTVDFLTQLLSLLDKVEVEAKRRSFVASSTSSSSSSASGPGVLITTGESSSRFYSNGIDLAWAAQNPDKLDQLSRLFQQVISRILTFPLITFAAINGHAFAGGLVLALAHDYRLMRHDRGWLCLPAVDIKLKLPIGVHALVKAKVPHPTLLRQVLLECKRFGGEEALGNGLVDWAGPLSELMPTTLEMARKIAARNLAMDVVSSLKQNLYGEIYSLLEVGGGIDGLEKAKEEKEKEKKLQKKTWNAVYNAAVPAQRQQQQQIKIQIEKEKEKEHQQQQKQEQRSQQISNNTSGGDKAVVLVHESDEPYKARL
jgi:enoyl-CoA hydratase/carnithine racemase